MCGERERQLFTLRGKLMSTPKIWVAPSILAADILNLEAELARTEQAGADVHHVDVMDGHFVPNLSYGLPIVKAVKKVSKLPVDVHIMISNPDEMALKYVDAGADYLSFHIEASSHAHRLADAIRKAGAVPGIAINPQTPISHISEMLPFVGFVNVMSVNPGFGGQSFIETTLKKIRTLKELLMAQGLADAVRIEVDGGVALQTVARVVEAGANMLVAGSYVYGSEDRAEAIASLKSPQN